MAGRGSAVSAFRHLVWRDIRLGWRQGGSTAVILGFFVIATSLFPLGLGPEGDFLARIAPGILWVMALLTSLLSFDRVWHGDFEDGSLDEMLCGVLEPTLVVSGKMLGHWLGVMIPLVLLVPVMGMLLNLPMSALPVIVISFVIGTPALSFYGSIGAALTLGVRRGGALLALLVMPLFIPTLIFGVAAVDAAILQLDPVANLALLGAASLFAGLISVPAATAALKLAAE